MAAQNPLPTDQVIQMRQQGYTDNQIIQTLQRQGISTQQIFDALSQAEIKAMPPPPLETPPEPAAPPPLATPPSPDYPPQAYPPAEEAYPGTEEKINEIAEAIISEKWEELITEVKKITAWKEKSEADIKKLNDHLAALKEDFKELRQGILGKITEYDEHMREVGSELKAVEKVFKDVIPSFTENVTELSRITKTLKKK